MTVSEKMMLKLLGGRSDNSFRFLEIDRLLMELGFQKRIKGYHHIYWKDEVDTNVIVKVLRGDEVRRL